RPHDLACLLLPPARHREGPRVGDAAMLAVGAGRDLEDRSGGVTLAHRCAVERRPESAPRVRVPLPIDARLGDPDSNGFDRERVLPPRNPRREESEAKPERAPADRSPRDRPDSHPYEGRETDDQPDPAPDGRCDPLDRRFPLVEILDETIPFGSGNIPASEKRATSDRLDLRARSPPRQRDARQRDRADEGDRETESRAEDSRDVVEERESPESRDGEPSQRKRLHEAQSAAPRQRRRGRQILRLSPFARETHRLSVPTERLFALSCSVPRRPARTHRACRAASRLRPSMLGPCSTSNRPLRSGGKIMSREGKR